MRVESVLVPAPGPNQVRLAIHAIGLNRTEVTLRLGRSPAKPSLPTSIGFEAAGLIEAVGPGVADWKIGDRVALVPAYSAAEYALYGELAVVPARSLVAIPGHQSYVQAAATWAAFGAAWAGLVHVGKLQPGKTVLITAASSSVGLAAIQIARRLGALPVALTRTHSKSDQLRSHGAADVIATSEMDLVQRVRNITNGRGAALVFDAVGGSQFTQLQQATETGGLLLLYGAMASEPTVVSPFQIFARDLAVRGFALPKIALDDSHLLSLKRFVLEGIADNSISPVVDHTFRFDDIRQAHEFIEAGTQVGKIVVEI